MAQITSFPGNTPEESDTSLFKRIAKHRISVLIRIIIAIVAIAAIVILSVKRYKSQIYTDFEIVNSTEKVSLENNAYINNNGSVITYSRDGISATDDTGKVIWNMTYEMQNPIVHTASGVVAVCDYNGHNVYLIDGNGKQTEIDTNLPIRDFCVSKDQTIATILEDNDNSWINLYSNTGAQLVEIKASIDKTGYPVAVTLSGEVLGVTYFYIDGSTMRSSVTFYNFGGIGENTSDHIVSSYDYADCVIPMIGFLDDENVFALGDNRLMFFEGAKKPVSSSDTILAENIVGAYYGDSGVGLVYYDTSGEHKYRIDLYEKNGKKTVEYGFDIDFKDILIHHGQIAIYNESQIIVLNEEGTEKYSGNLPDSVIFLSATESNRKYIAITKDAVEALEFE